MSVKHECPIALKQAKEPSLPSDVTCVAGNWNLAVQTLGSTGNKVGLCA
jgi:hypothetical protein